MNLYRKQTSSKSSRTDLFNADTGSIELPNLPNAKRVAGNMNIRLAKLDTKNNNSDTSLPPLKEPGILLLSRRYSICIIDFILSINNTNFFISIPIQDEIRHSKVAKKISTDPIQESLTLPKLVLKNKEVSKMVQSLDKKINRI